MSNEQLFFGLSQALRKFPKETGKFAATTIVVCPIKRTQSCDLVGESELEKHHDTGL